MAEVAQYNFELSEITELLIKKQGIHEGLWAIGINFNIAAGLMGPSPSESYPSAMIQIMSLGLTKVDLAQNPISPGTRDAAVVNPRAATPPGSPKARSPRRASKP